MIMRELEVDRGMLICLVSALVKQMGGKGVVTMREIEYELTTARLDIEFDAKTRSLTLSCIAVD